MTTRWLETKSDDEVRDHGEGFWDDLRRDLHTGEFWADKIKQYKDEPSKRLALAFENLPIPGAFREAAVALRSIIRAKRKAKESYQDELKLLYRLAAINSFMLDYAPRLKEPGFNVMESVPGSRIQSLQYKYPDLGYRKLSLLNKTDWKWLIDSWGEPNDHTTLNQLYRSVWDEYETKLIEQRKESNQNFLV